MLRSLFSGVSGMRTHQLDMDVIADNIANVNTTGFKASRMTFREVYSQLLRGARGPLGSLGGANPLQVGLGVAVSSIDTVFVQGAPQSTGRNTDLAIDGNGFFILTPDDGNTRFYTRAGNFSVDSQDNLVYVNGMKVMGWNAAGGVVDPSTPLSPINFSDDKSMLARATTTAELTGNLDSSLPPGTDKSISFDVFDSKGRRHVLELRLTKTGTPNVWYLWPPTLDGNSPNSFTSTNFQFDTNGRPIGPTSTQVTWTLSPDANDLTVTIDWKRMTQFAQESDPALYSQDGYPAGSLVEFTIDDAGVIKGVFSNGRTQPLGQIALATFVNQEGLVKKSDTLFAESPNSGGMTPGAANSGNRGRLVPGFLEMSNVDLSQEFTNLILAQRGFQANSRVITTSDEMLQELMTLKR